MGSQRVRQDWVSSLSFHFMSLRMKPAQGTEDLGNEEKYNSGISFSDHRFIVYDIIMGAPPSTQAWTWNLCSFMSQLNLFVLRTQFGLFFFFVICNQGSWSWEPSLCMPTSCQPWPDVHIPLSSSAWLYKINLLLFCALKEALTKIIVQQSNKFFMNGKNCWVMLQSCWVAKTNCAITIWSNMTAIPGDICLPRKIRSCKWSYSLGQELPEVKSI